MNSVVKQRIADIQRGNVPVGYQKTKLGIIPADWQEVCFGNILHNEVRKVTKPQTAYWRLGIRSHAKGTFRELVEDPTTVNMDELYSVQTNDLVVNITFAWEHAIAIVKEEDAGLLVSHRFPTYVFNENASADFYKYIISQKWVKEQLDLISPGGAGRNRVMNKNAFLKMPCYTLSLEEQRRIADILGCCDRVIALKKELIAEKKKQKKALMQKLLNPDSGFRLPGFSGEWKTVKLKEVCDINTSSLSENTNPDKSFYYLDLATVDKGKIVNEPAFVTFRNAPCRARRLFKKGDILFSTVRPYLCGFLFADFVADDYVASTGFAILTSQIGNMIGKLLYHHLFSDNIILQTQYLLSGTNYPALNSYDVENLYINIPKDIKEQQAIADILSAADKEIDLLEQELAQQEQKKKSLMQLLLTGIVRV